MKTTIQLETLQLMRMNEPEQEEALRSGSVDGSRPRGIGGRRGTYQCGKPGLGATGEVQWFGSFARKQEEENLADKTGEKITDENRHNYIRRSEVSSKPM